MASCFASERVGSLRPKRGRRGGNNYALHDQCPRTYREDQHAHKGRKVPPNLPVHHGGPATRSGLLHRRGRRPRRLLRRKRGRSLRAGPQDGTPFARVGGGDTDPVRMDTRRCAKCDAGIRASGTEVRLKERRRPAQRRFEGRRGLGLPTLWDSEGSSLSTGVRGRGILRTTSPYPRGRGVEASSAIERSRSAARIIHAITTPTKIRWNSPAHSPLGKKNVTSATKASTRDKRQYDVHQAWRLKVLLSTNIPSTAHTKATEAERMCTVPTTVCECIPPRSMGKKASSSTPTPKRPKRTEPTRDPQEPLVASRMPVASAKEPSPNATNASVWTKPNRPMASSLM